MHFYTFFNLENNKKKKKNESDFTNKIKKNPTGVWLNYNFYTKALFSIVEKNIKIK